MLTVCLKVVTVFFYAVKGEATFAWFGRSQLKKVSIMKSKCQRIDLETCNLNKRQRRKNIADVLYVLEEKQVWVWKQKGGGPTWQCERQPRRTVKKQCWSFWHTHTHPPVGLFLFVVVVCGRETTNSRKPWRIPTTKVNAKKWRQHQRTSKTTTLRTTRTTLRTRTLTNTTLRAKHSTPTTSWKQPCQQHQPWP